MENKTIVRLQEKIFQNFPPVQDYYLGGGTALARVYFNHRDSLDLDFFTHKFSRKEIVEFMKKLSVNIKKDTRLIGEQSDKRFLRMLVFNVIAGGREGLKIDFLEDWLNLIRPVRMIDKMPVLSLEDIYIRKIYTITGTMERRDIVGRKIFIGAREEAKDFYDLYFLSHTFQKLSEFIYKYGNQALKEAVINWFRKYDRMNIKVGIQELAAKKEVDYQTMEKHFKKEIDDILRMEIG